MAKLLIPLLLTLIVGCSDTIEQSYRRGYRTPDLTTTYTLANKGYNLTGIGESCASSTSCTAIAFASGGQAGIAVRDSHEAAANRDFTMMVYWNADALPTGPGEVTGSYTVVIQKGDSTYATTGNNLLSFNGTSTYSFLSGVTASRVSGTGDPSVAINIASTVTVQSY
jgi:hypothetical protein